MLGAPMPNPEIQILVCCNERPDGATKPSCAPRKALDLYRSIKDGVRSRGIRDRVMVVRTGCLKHCSRGVAVHVWPWNHLYQGVTRDDVDDLLDGATEGAEVERLRMPDIPWE